MKKWKKMILVVLPLVGVSALIGACATTSCNNDACYNRRLSSVDPYKEGDIAAWGSEKEQAAQDEQKEKTRASRVDGFRGQ
jgi:hypothetical protein